MDILPDQDELMCVGLRIDVTCVFEIRILLKRLEDDFRMQVLYQNFVNASTSTLSRLVFAPWHTGQ